MEPEGEGENRPPPYRSPESTECATETASEAVWDASPIPAAQPVEPCSSGFFLG